MRGMYTCLNGTIFFHDYDVLTIIRITVISPTPGPVVLNSDCVISTR